MIEAGFNSPDVVGTSPFPLEFIVLMAFSVVGCFLAVVTANSAFNPPLDWRDVRRYNIGDPGIRHAC
jgi:hypothetical protein